MFYNQGESKEDGCLLFNKIPWVFSLFFGRHLRKNKSHEISILTNRTTKKKPLRKLKVSTLDIDDISEGLILKLSHPKVHKDRYK